jgi:capsid protein
LKSSKRSIRSNRSNRPKSGRDLNLGAKKLLPRLSGAAPVEKSPRSNAKKSTMRAVNSYDAAGYGRRLQMWRPGNAGPNASIVGDLATLRDRSRESLRNNGWMVQGVNNLVSNIIGFGISPEPMSPSKGFNEDAKGLPRRARA